jgi:putative transposase
MSRQDYPKNIRVDQGSEFVSRDLDLWAYANKVILDFSRPGKPTDNAFIEAFNSKVRSECLNAHWFMSLDDARSKLEDRRRYYNEESRHSGIGQMVPIVLHNPGGAHPARHRPKRPKTPASGDPVIGSGA